MSEKIKFTVYLAGAIEKATMAETLNWRTEIENKLKCKDIVFYNPITREMQKTGRSFKEQGDCLKGLKQGGHWDKFREELRKIWFGGIKPESGHIPDIFTFLRTRKMIDGNELRDLDFWADWEAVLRSDFIIALMEKDVPTIGTVGEIFVSYIFKIPIYLVIDVPKTEANSTLLDWVLGSGGDVFYSVNEVSKFIIEKYGIKTEIKIDEEKK
jgi:hypothetical protein